MTNMQECMDRLVARIAGLPEVVGIGTPGKTLPNPGEGDIDLFIYCEHIPSESQREAMLTALPDVDDIEIGVYSGGHWGIGDFVSLAGVDTSLMFFTIAETNAEIKALLAGERLDKENNYYYPLGRCAMLQNIRVLYDIDEVFAGFKSQLAKYPIELSKTVVKHHLAKLDDIEDLLRAVARKDVLFYHFSIELALDIFLQTLFALNQIFFPSRKRSLEYISGFAVKPQDCEQRLLDVLQLGGSSNTLQQSYDVWQGLVSELVRLCSDQLK